MINSNQSIPWSLIEPWGRETWDEQEAKRLLVDNLSISRLMAEVASRRSFCAPKTLEADDVVAHFFVYWWETRLLRPNARTDIGMPGIKIPPPSERTSPDNARFWLMRAMYSAMSDLCGKLRRTEQRQTDAEASFAWNESAAVETSHRPVGSSPTRLRCREVAENLEYGSKATHMSSLFYLLFDHGHLPDDYVQKIALEADKHRRGSKGLGFVRSPMDAERHLRLWLSRHILSNDSGNCVPTKKSDSRAVEQLAWIIEAPEGISFEDWVPENTRGIRDRVLTRRRETRKFVEAIVETENQAQNERMRERMGLGPAERTRRLDGTGRGRIRRVRRMPRKEGDES
jgi:hypothetical protein